VYTPTETPHALTCPHVPATTSVVSWTPASYIQVSWALRKHVWTCVVHIIRKQHACNGSTHAPTRAGVCILVENSFNFLFQKCLLRSNLSKRSWIFVFGFFFILGVFVTPSTAMKFRLKFFWKWSFFDQNQEPLKSVEPFGRKLRALFISQCPYKFSSFLDLSNAFDRFRLFSRDFRLFRFFFPGSACFSTLVSPQNLPSWLKYYGKFESFGKEFRRTKFIAVEGVSKFSSVQSFLFVCLFVGIKPEKLCSASCVGREVNPLGVITHGQRHKPHAYERQRYIPRTRQFMV